MSAPPLAWHQVAHAPPGTRPLVSPIAACWFWARLRKACTPRDATGQDRWACAALMPDHVHLVHFAEPERKRLALARLLGSFARQHGTGKWQVPHPERIVGLDKLLRQLRYVHLNSCRAGFIRDPLSWPWSTHRDAVGAVYNPWLSLGELGVGRFGWRSLELEFHRYVSSDPSVHPAGSPFPQRASRRATPDMSLGQIWGAVVTSSPWCGNPRQRERFVALAWHQGWRHATLLSRTAGIRAGQVRRMWRRELQLDLAPATLCLGDERLRNARGA